MRLLSAMHDVAVNVSTKTHAMAVFVVRFVNLIIFLNALNVKIQKLERI